MRTSPNPDDLLTGPRGRRLLLELLLDDGASYRPELEDLGARDLAACLAPLPRPSLTESSLVRALSATVSHAMYWQDPDPLDAALSAPPVVDALRPAAEHVAASPLTAWWWSGLSPEQAHVAWVDDVGAAHDPAATEPPTFPNPGEALAADAAERVALERDAAARPLPSDPAEDVSGPWWSAPPRTLATTTRRLTGGAPVGLWCEEDGDSSLDAVVRSIRPPAGARLLEIASAQDWADLCRRHPLTVTRSTRHDWFATTGRDGAWVLPDWQAVAADGVDAIHLSVAGYLTLAGRTIEVGDGAASVVAGWNPDEAFWLSDLALPATDATAADAPCAATTAGTDGVAWRFTPDDHAGTWTPASA